MNSVFSIEISKFQSLAAQIDEASRSTIELKKLLNFIESRLREQLNLDATIVLYPEATETKPQPLDLVREVLLSKGSRVVGKIQLGKGTDRLSTEQEAALHFLATQIVAAIENCKLAESKIRLERELAERDRLVLSKKMSALGQLVADIFWRPPIASLA